MLAEMNDTVEAEMNDTVEGVRTRIELLALCPGLSRNFAQWLEARDKRPSRLNALNDGIESLSKHLEIFLPALERCERTASEQQALILRMRKQQLHRRLEQLGKMKGECTRLGVSKKRFGVHPSVFHNTVNKCEEQCREIGAELNDVVCELNTGSEIQVNRFKVVTNVPRNAHTIIMDFESKDKDGNFVTPEAQFKDAIFGASDNKAMIGAVAQGLGGVGKTCALRAIGQLEETERRFPGGTLYVTIGAEGGLSQLVSKIADTVYEAGDEERAARIRENKSLSYATSKAGEWFGKEPCLFLIDDIWCVNGITAECIEELCNLVRHSGSRIACTTRDTKVDCGTKIVFRERPQCGENARCILLGCANMKQPLRGTEASKALNEILKLCNGLPLALSVCGKAVKHFAQFRCDSCPEDAWTKYWGSRKHRPVLYSDKRSAKNMKESVLLSLSFIDEDLDMAMSETRYRGLCILRNQQFVPNDVLCRLWGISSESSSEFVGRLERFGIAHIHYRSNGEKMWIGLHGVLLDISRELAAESDESWQWSRALIASYANSSCCNTSQSDRGTEVLDGFQERWMGVEDDGYIFQNICRLLMIGKCAEDLLWMMTSAEWIIKQLLQNGHRQVQEDIQAAMKDLHGACTRARRMDWEEIRGFLKALHNAVQLSAKRVRESEWNGMAWFEVYGRLIHLKKNNEAVRRFLEKVKDKAPRPWLKPSAGCLAPAGECLRHVMELGATPLCQTEVNSTVLACYRAAGSLYIKRYDTQTGVESSSDVLLSNVSEVSCAAFSSSGEHLAVGMHDGRIVLCNLNSSTAVSIHEDSGNPGQPERGEAGGENEMSEEGENIKCGIMGWRHIFGWCYFGRKERGEGGEVGGDRDYEERNSDEGWGGRSSRGEDIYSRSELESDRGSIESVRSIAVSNDGRHVVSGSSDGIVRVWKKDGDEWVSAVLHGHDNTVTSVSMNRDGTRLASGSDDKTVRVWEKEGDEWVSAVLHGHYGFVQCVSMNGDGTRVASGSLDKTIRVWEKDGDEWVSAVLHGHNKSVVCVSMNGDGTRVASGSDDKTVRVWEKDGDEWVSAVLRGHDGPVTSVWMSRDGQHVVSKDGNDQTLSWRKQGEQWVTADVGVGDVSLAGSHVAHEDVSWKGQVSDELFEEVIRPLATDESFPTAFGYFITMFRKPYIAQIDVIH